MVGIVANLHIEHWKADRKTNEHRALGDLYDDLDGHLDTFVELTMGRCGSSQLQKGTVSLNSQAYADLIKTALEKVATTIEQATADAAQDLVNVLADMQTALNHAKYFLMIQ